ncbi:hypothetical protein [Kitasatospora phosalacinea]|uniref:hypothetical protein n=1 Tax=Kitasatospora phosalacinea TaxID=2065 RepID=UPI000526441B|nr:hypothetical protein [Kitasatospora phosalacinea]
MSTEPLADTVSADAADRHGHRFLLIGKKTIFSYHLGLYHVPIHAFQLITRFGLPDTLRERYLADLAAHENQQVYYSLFTEGHWPLSELVEGTRTSLEVELERVTVNSAGERTFTPILDAVDVTSRKEDVAHYRPLEPGSDYPDFVTELSFGQDDEVHLAHQLAGAPNWDEVITTVDPQGLRPGSATETVVLAVKDPHGAAPKSPLTPGTRYEGRTGDRAVSFTVGRQGWWNNTSLNKE